MTRGTTSGMAGTMTPEALQALLGPYLSPAEGLRSIGPRPELLGALLVYLDLLLKWNARTNLTAVREPREIVRRHFGESFLLARLCPEGARTVLDLGSGAGFPGLPLQLAWPDLQVTLAESQGRKAAFLREVIRELRLPTEVWAGRAEERIGSRQIDLVTMRAVDRMEQAVALAERMAPGLLLLATAGDLRRWGVDVVRSVPVPGSDSGLAARCASRPAAAGVPRGTRENARGEG